MRNYLRSYLSPKFYRFLIDQRWAFVGLLLSVIALVTLSVSFLAEAIYFNDPRHKNAELEAWMTPRYISLSYELPRPVVLEVLGLKEGSQYPKRLDKLSKQLGFTLDELTERVRNAKTNRIENIND